MYNRKVLVDADILLMRAALHCEVTSTIVHEDGTEEKVVDTVEEEEGYQYIDNAIFFLHLYLKPRELVMYLSNTDRAQHHRYHIPNLSTPYKNKRKEKPVHYGAMRHYVENMYGCRIAYGEADDDLATDLQVGDILASVDKDLWQVKGLHWDLSKNTLTNIKTDLGFLHRIPGRSLIYGGGFKWFCAQMVIGDTADAIPGLWRKGPVYAYEEFSELTSEQECWDHLKSLYWHHNGSQEYFDQHCELLWMNREPGRTMPHFSDGVTCDRSIEQCL